MLKSSPVYPISSMENESKYHELHVANTMDTNNYTHNHNTDNDNDNDASKQNYAVLESRLPGSSRSMGSTTTNLSVTVCCGCRPKAKRKTKKFQTLEPSRKKWWKKAVVANTRIKNWRYRDANTGEDSEWKAFSKNRDDVMSIKSSEAGDGDDESMYFFDAVDRPLGDDEYPIDGYAIGAQKFKVVFTTSIQSPSRRVSLTDPDSMLRPRSRSSSLGSLSSLNDFQDACYDETELEPLTIDHHSKGSRNDKILNHKEPSMRFRKIRKRSAEELAADLKKPSAATIEDAIGMAGYPGTLTVDQLDECQKFVTRLNDLPSAVSEQIYSLRDVEEQPYTICRWLRATKFDADAILKRCVENQPLFDEAKEAEFFGPDLEEHLGCPFSVFLSQYPFLSIGCGKNGSPVNYFNVGRINPEGIMCLITFDQLKCYFWYSFMYSFKDNVRASQAENPDFCRCEGINVLDLGGLSASALTTETMEVIKMASKISDFFPETLHCMLVLNAPSFFSFSWKLIKNFIDPRTASRIQLFSSKEKGQKSLEKLIDKNTQIPSDYGGGNISLQEAFLNECSDPDIVRQLIELLHCRRRCKKALPKTWTLKADENIEITVYTRSVGKASVEVILNGSMIKTVHAQCSFVDDEQGSVTSIPYPRKTVVMTSLAGPGEVMVEAHDLDSPISKAHSHSSRGYFLVVGDVKKMSRTRNGMSSVLPSPDVENRRVSFSSDVDTITITENYNNNNSPYNTKKPPLGAKVTMTGLSFPTPIKVIPKYDRKKRKKKKLML